KEIDPTTGEPDESGYDDEYQVEDVELLGSDYVTPAYAGSFDHVWEQTGANGDEAAETLQLSSTKSIADATEQLIKTLSLQPLDGTDISVSPSTHTLKLYGKTLGGGKVAALVKMAYSAKTGVTTKITVRSEEEGVAALLATQHRQVLQQHLPGKFKRPSLMAQKRKNHRSTSNNSQAKRARYDDGEEESTTGQSVKAQVDPTYGQRSAFPGLDDAANEDDLFYGPASDGLEYLRMVRSEAKGVPNLLIAPRPALTDREELYQDYPQGYYADGAYTAVPAAPHDTRTAKAKADQLEVLPQEAYHNYLLKSFRTLRSLLCSSSAPPSAPSRSVLTTITEVNEAPARKWRLHLLYTAPTTSLLNQMNQDTVMAGITALEKLLTWKTLEKDTYVGAWAWGLLAKCREVGQMGGEEVAVLRELGKKAKTLVRALMAGLGLAEEMDSEDVQASGDERDQEEEGSEKIEDSEGRPSGDTQMRIRGTADQTSIKVQDTEGAQNGKDSSNDRVSGTEDQNQSLANSTMESSVTDGNFDEMVLAKRRLLSTLEQPSSPPHHSTSTSQTESMRPFEYPPPPSDIGMQSSHSPPHTSELKVPDATVDEPQEDPLPLTTRITATLDMVITIVGEVYGQRDLLAGRMMW
ncbi:MAG: hypothetical protein Q9218_008103, partial [Villophora microphyllina]